MTKSELVRAAREGDREAYDRLLVDVIDHLYRIARLILRDFDSAEDAVQEALVRCWRDLPALRDVDRFDAWLNRIAVRAINDEARARRQFSGRVSSLRLATAQPDDVDAVADRDAIARVFDRLSVEHRTVVVLHHYLGMTDQQAAAAIGIPAGTVKSRLHHATEALRAAIDADARATSTGRVYA